MSVWCVLNPFFCEDCIWKTTASELVQKLKPEITETAASLQQVALLGSLSAHVAASYMAHKAKQVS